MMDRSTDKNTENRKEKKKTYRGRLVAAFVVVLVTTLLEIIYYGYHIMDNRDNVVHSFKNEQDSTAQIIADGLAGKSEDAMIHFIRHSVPVSGTTWGFILKDGRVLYMKDDDTTKNLENISSKAEFELYMEDLGGIVSEASVSGTEYVLSLIHISGIGISSLSIISRKRSLSSARLMTAGDVPRIFTPFFSRSEARLRGV